MIGECSYAAARIASLLKNPENGGMPEIATHAQHIVQNVIGIFLRRPPIWRMSCSPSSAWITLPAPRNRSALKNACVTTCHTPAPYAPDPMPTNMYPSCETVEY